MTPAGGHLPPPANLLRPVVVAWCRSLAAPSRTPPKRWSWTPNSELACSCAAAADPVACCYLIAHRGMWRPGLPAAVCPARALSCDVAQPARSVPLYDNACLLHLPCLPAVQKPTTAVEMPAMRWATSRMRCAGMRCGVMMDGAVPSSSAACAALPVMHNCCC